MVGGPREDGDGDREKVHGEAVLLVEEDAMDDKAPSHDIELLFESQACRLSANVRHCALTYQFSKAKVRGSICLANRG